MFDPFGYMVKTPETMLLGITHYDDLMKWCNDDASKVYHLLEVFFDRDEVLEKIISKDAKYSYQYAKDVLKGSFELGERAISNDGYFSYLYARKVLDGPFVLGEKSMSNLKDYSFYYAIYVLKGRFELGEKSILNSKYKDQYLSFINQ